MSELSKPPAKWAIFRHSEEDYGEADSGSVEVLCFVGVCRDITMPYAKYPQISRITSCYVKRRPGLGSPYIYVPFPVANQTSASRKECARVNQKRHAPLAK